MINDSLDGDILSHLKVIDRKDFWLQVAWIVSAGAVSEIALEDGPHLNSTVVFALLIGPARDYYRGLDLEPAQYTQNAIIRTAGMPGPILAIP